MAIGDDEITTCNSQLDTDDEFDDDINSIMERLHNNLKESYVRNKELKKRSIFLFKTMQTFFDETRVSKMKIKT